jgi:hypothetical protein
MLDGPTVTIAAFRREFWRTTFPNRTAALRWWSELLHAFGASLPEAAAWANAWANANGYRSRGERQ